MSNNILPQTGRGLTVENLSIFALVGALAVAFVGCLGGKNDDVEEKNVAFSSPAVDQTVSGALDDLRRLATLNEKKDATICFLGVSGRAPGASAAAFSAATRRQIESGSSFRTLEKSVVENALKESGVRANNLFIPAERKKFAAELGEPIDFLLTGTLDAGKKDDSNDDDPETFKTTSTGPTYRLELVDLATNKKYEYVAQL